MHPHMTHVHTPRVATPAPVNTHAWAGVIWHAWAGVIWHVAEGGSMHMRPAPATCACLIATVALDGLMNVWYRCKGLRRTSQAHVCMHAGRQMHGSNQPDMHVGS